MIYLLDALLILAGWALLFWALLTWHLAAPVTCGEAADPYAGEIAEFRRQIHDWDREG